MNIIAGRHKGKKLKAPKGLVTRPVLGKVREALFNVFGDIEGLRFLDLFAGTGAIGLEALSRGAESAVFVEKGEIQCRIIRENLTWLGEDAQILKSDVLRILKHLAANGERYDIIFADPPYETGLSQKTTAEVCTQGILAPAGIFAVTVRSTEEMPESPGDCSIVFDRRYGDTRLIMYGRISEK